MMEIFKYYGPIRQATKLVEELEELLEAIDNSSSQDFLKPKLKFEILEEMADVHNMIEEFFMAKNQAEDFFKIKEIKIFRQHKRIREEGWKVREQTCIICGHSFYGIGHHIKTKGAGGSDEKFNLMPLCISHHTLSGESVHRLGIKLFASKFKEAKLWLLNNDWEFDPVSGKWLHPKFMIGNG